MTTKDLLSLPVRDTMTDDRFNLHRVDTSQLGERDGVSVGGRCNHDCDEGRSCPQRIEYAGDEPSGVDWFAVAAIGIALAVIVVASFSVEIAASLYAFTK